MSQSLAEFLGTLSEKQEESTVEAWLPEKKSAKSFSRALLESPEYRNSLRVRIVTGALAPAIECKLWDYAYGKPVERVEMKDTTTPLESLSIEQVEDRILRLSELARQLRRMNDTTLEDDSGDAAVH